MLQDTSSSVTQTQLVQSDRILKRNSTGENADFMSHPLAISKSTKMSSLKLRYEKTKSCCFNVMLSPCSKLNQVLQLSFHAFIPIGWLADEDSLMCYRTYESLEVPFRTSFRP